MCNNEIKTFTERRAGTFAPYKEIRYGFPKAWKDDVRMTKSYSTMGTFYDFYMKWKLCRKFNVKFDSFNGCWKHDIPLKDCPSYSRADLDKIKKISSDILTQEANSETTHLVCHYIFYHLNTISQSLIDEIYSLLMMLTCLSEMDNYWNQYDDNDDKALNMIDTPLLFIQKDIISNIDRFIENYKDIHHFEYDVKMHNQNGVGAVIDFLIDDCLFEIKCGQYNIYENKNTFVQLIVYASYLYKIHNINIRKLCMINPRENKRLYWDIENYDLNDIYEKFERATI